MTNLYPVQMRDAFTKEFSKTAVINQRYKKWMIMVLSVVFCIIGVFAQFKDH